MKKPSNQQTTWHEIARPQVHGYDMQCIALLGRYRLASGADEKVSGPVSNRAVYGDGKKRFESFSWCNLRLKFRKITSGFILTERWEAGNYHIIFWSVTSKAEFSS